MRLSILVFLFAGAVAPVLIAQSSDQNYPTPITANELRGVINARTIGDSRLTTHFYVFEGSQGDIFINVVAKNFTGDIDVFGADDMRPLAKMVIYGDVGVTENGRLIYLRKRERLLLRVEGRTPGDEPATYQIKFAGSFVAMAPVKEEPPPTISDEKVADIKVAREPIKRESPKEDGGVSVAEKKTATRPERKKITKPVVVVDDPVASREPEKKKANSPAKTAQRATTRKASAPKPPDPLANVRLVIVMKDGSVIERTMSDVQRFGYDKGVLTVVLKTGRITSYAVADIATVTLQ